MLGWGDVPELTKYFSQSDLYDMAGNGVALTMLVKVLEPPRKHLESI